MSACLPSPQETTKQKHPRKDSIFNTWCWKNWIFTLKRAKLKAHPQHIHQLQSQLKTYESFYQTEQLLQSAGNNGAQGDLWEGRKQSHCTDTSEGNIQHVWQISKAQVSKTICFFVLFGNKGNGVQGGPLPWAGVLRLLFTWYALAKLPKFAF